MCRRGTTITWPLLYGKRLRMTNASVPRWTTSGSSAGPPRGRTRTRRRRCHRSRRPASRGSRVVARASHSVRGARSAASWSAARRRVGGGRPGERWPSAPGASSPSASRLSRSFSSLPGLKYGTFFGGTSTLSPVLGLRPLRGSRWRSRKLPKPRSSIFSPRCRASMMLWNTVSTMTSECFLVRSETRETSSTSSAFVMLPVDMKKALCDTPAVAPEPGTVSWSRDSDARDRLQPTPDCGSDRPASPSGCPTRWNRSPSRSGTRRS